MILAKVIGTVVSTCKDEGLHASKLLIVQPVDVHGNPKPGYMVAKDTVGAGAGETVLIVTGSSARMARGSKDSPIDAAIIGIVDIIKLDPNVKLPDDEKPAGKTPSAKQKSSSKKAIE